MQIVGAVTLTTHAHQSDPEGRKGNHNGTMKTGIFDADGQRRTVPFITANSVRGLLRRAAAEHVFEAIGAPVSRQMFHVLTRGSASRDGIGEPTVPALAKGRKHVFAGLFGGGPAMLHGGFKMSPLMPLVAWCEKMIHPSLRSRVIPLESITGTRRDDGVEYDVKLTTNIILTGKDDLLAGRGQEHVEDYQKSLDAWIAEVTGGREAKADAKAAVAKAKKEGTTLDPSEAKARSVDLSAFNTIEGMLPGTPLQFDLLFKKGVTKAQIGMGLIAVRDWANANTIGGASARGFGRFTADLALYDGDQVIAPSIFNIGDHSAAYSFNDDIMEYVEAAKAELKALDVDELDEIYPTDKPKKAAVSA